MSAEKKGTKDLTKGPITSTMLLFALPMILGNLLQQFYQIADTLIVGRYLGADALAAVGSSYTLMTFLTSILLGLCMGCGAYFSICYGKRDGQNLRNGIFVSFSLIFVVTLAINGVVFAGLDQILKLLQVPQEVYSLMRDYLWAIFWGIVATFLCNFFASLLRSVGDSKTPLIFLGIASVMNIILDLAFVLVFKLGVSGAAWATVLAQWFSGIGLFVYVWRKVPELRISRKDMQFSLPVVKSITHFSLSTCIQQSVMNFGILMVQGLVNSFGTIVMAAFAAAVKIDSFAYMPVQDFGNAFSTFIAQNHGAEQENRIRKGMKSAIVTVILFGVTVSAVVCIFAEPLLRIFVSEKEKEVLQIGAQYLRIEGSFYIGIGVLFLLYGLYRAIQKPGMSLVLTMISLGTRVGLAYTLSAVSTIGVLGIWWSVPIGWFLADAVGIGYYMVIDKKNSIKNKISHST